MDGTTQNQVLATINSGSLKVTLTLPQKRKSFLIIFLLPVICVLSATAPPKILKQQKKIITKKNLKATNTVQN